MEYKQSVVACWRRENAYNYWPPVRQRDLVVACWRREKTYNEEDSTLCHGGFCGLLTKRRNTQHIGGEEVTVWCCGLLTKRKYIQPAMCMYMVKRCCGLLTKRKHIQRWLSLSASCCSCGLLLKRKIDFYEKILSKTIRFIFGDAIQSPRKRN